LNADFQLRKIAYRITPPRPPTAKTLLTVEASDWLALFENVPRVHGLLLLPADVLWLGKPLRYVALAYGCKKAISSLAKAPGRGETIQI